MVRKDGLLGAWKRPRGRNTRAGRSFGENDHVRIRYRDRNQYRNRTRDRRREPPRWRGPFTEYDKYGEPTGAEYVRCSACGVEVIAGDTQHATHRDGCDGAVTLN